MNERPGTTFRVNGRPMTCGQTCPCARLDAAHCYARACAENSGDASDERSRVPAGRSSALRAGESDGVATLPKPDFERVWPHPPFPLAIYEAAQILSREALTFEARPPFDHLGRYVTVRAGGFEHTVNIVADAPRIVAWIVDFVRAPCDTSALVYASASCEGCGTTLTAAHWKQELADRDAIAMMRRREYHAPRCPVSFAADEAPTADEARQRDVQKPCPHNENPEVPTP